MFYEPKHGHGLPHNPFNAIVLPRPIGWISTRATDGSVNLAPYSFFNAIAYTPPQVMFSATEGHQGAEGLKDSARVAIESGEFVANLATWALREKMNTTSTPAPPGIDEFDVAGLTKAECHCVRAPRVAESPVNLECTVVTHVPLRGTPGVTPATMVIGEVVGVHIADELLVDGLVDVTRLDAIGRLGYRQYVRVTEAFEMTRPGWPVPGSTRE
ncbi:MAG: flavin reductase family protein [Gaiella sp.]